MLAGLIADEDRSTASRVPGLGSLPLLGRLFSNQRDELSKTEIVMIITPRIIRNIERPELIDGEFFSGTDLSASDQPLLLRPSLSTSPAPAAPRFEEPLPAPSQTAVPEAPAEPPQPAPLPAQ